MDNHVVVGGIGSVGANVIVDVYDDGLPPKAHASAYENVCVDDNDKVKDYG